MVILLEWIGYEFVPEKALSVASLLVHLQSIEDDVTHLRMRRVEGMSSVIKYSAVDSNRAGEPSSRSRSLKNCAVSIHGQGGADTGGACTDDDSVLHGDTQCLSQLEWMGSLPAI